ncbi:MAG: hypothetical protein GY847_17900 [Proteobacteria bacterium]|nr:hypothetical protein [Pseudomonadota bacterium]
MNRVKSFVFCMLLSLSLGCSKKSPDDTKNDRPPTTQIKSSSTPTTIPTTIFVKIDHKNNSNQICNLKNDYQEEIEDCTMKYRLIRPNVKEPNPLTNEQKEEITTSFLNYMNSDMSSWLHKYIIKDTLNKTIYFNIISLDKKNWFGDKYYQSRLDDIHIKSWIGTKEIIQKHISQGASEVVRLTATVTFDQEIDKNQIIVLTLGSNTVWLSSKQDNWKFTSMGGHWGDAPAYSVIFDIDSNEFKQEIRTSVPGGLTPSTICCLINSPTKQNCSCFQRRESGYNEPDMDKKYIKALKKMN